MARTERPGRPRARLFIALEPEDTARSALARWRDDLVAGREELRPVAPDALHVTLVFLGWQCEADVERIAEAGLGALGGMPPACLRPAGVRPLPDRAPRLFALDLDDEGGRAGAAQSALSSGLEAAGFYRPERRPFWPHLTLARVKRGRRTAPLDVPGLPGAFDAARVTLYRSTLRPQGAVYEPLVGQSLR